MTHGMLIFRLIAVTILIAMIIFGDHLTKMLAYALLLLIWIASRLARRSGDQD